MATNRQGKTGTVKVGGTVLPILAAVAFVAVSHFAALVVVFTAASGWDSACDILFDDSGHPGQHSNTRMVESSHYVDPGFTCAYGIMNSNETLVLRRDLTGARNLVVAITIGAAIVGSAGYFVRRRRNA
jgi:LPXTG-motif cell wall-anchored protein